MRIALNVAVLALQGDFDKHLEAVREAGAEAFPAVLPAEIERADAIIIPGGESTTIGKLMARFVLDEAILSAHRAGKPIYGTCAGLILVARDIDSSTEERGGQTTLGILDVTVARNAYGRQLDSFEEDIDVSEIGGPSFHAVFIRAPKITGHGRTVEVLAEQDGSPALVRQGNVLASTFHPELSGDSRIHKLFLRMAGHQKG